MSDQPRTVKLTRAVEDGGRETFGFSVSGGAGTKLPVVVWEVTPGLPAALSASVSVGDVLMAVNDVQLDNMSQTEVVGIIMSSPQVSTFVFKTDEAIQSKVKRIKARQAGGGRIKREQQLVEPSVNFSGSSDIVKGSLPSRGLTTKGITPKRSFIQRRTSSTRVQSRNRLSEGEEPLDTTNLLMVPSDNSSPRMTRASLSMSPPSPRQQCLSDVIHCNSKSVDNLPDGSSQWDGSIASSQSELSMDLLSGSCDSLGSAATEADKTCSNPSVGQSSAIKVSSEDKKHVIKNLANLTSLEVAGLGGDKQSSCSHEPSVSPSTETTQHPLENIAEEQPLPTEHQASPIGQPHPIVIEDLHPSVDKAGKTWSLQSNASAQSIGEVIISTENNDLPEVDVMTSVEIRHSKYGPHRYSSSDEPSDTGSHGEDTSSHGDANTGSHNNVVSHDADDTGSYGDDTGSHDGSHSNDVDSHDNVTFKIGPRSSGSYGSKLRGTTSETGLRVRRTLSGRPLRTLDSQEEAVMLARKLYMLDGYKRSEVARHLSDKSPFNQSVAEEYLKLFDFENISLDQALRQFVCSFILSGETHEQERIMQHFSRRYHGCNPTVFTSSDSCHSLICALLLLNTDLHAEHTGSRMTQTQFITNISGTGEHYPKEMLKVLYDSIKKNALPLAIDEDVKVTSSPPLPQNGTGNHEPPSSVPVYHVTFPGTFIEVDLAGDAPVFKEGEIYRKNVMEGPHKKVQSGKRKWKPFYAYLKGFLLYFIEPHEELYLDKTTNALPITHCIAQRAFDYHKRSSVLRVTTSDWKVFLLQAPSVTEMQQWMSAINKAAGTYSSTPLAAPIGSSSHFQRPMLPLAPTKLSQEQQLESHNSRVKSLEKDLEEHRAYHSGNVSHKGKSSQVWREKLEYLEFEITRYRIYIACMTSTSIEELQTPYPSSLVPSPSVSTLATMNMDDCTFGTVEPPSPTLSTHSHTGYKQQKKHRKHH